MYSSGILTFKNAKTGEAESIKQNNIEKLEWGFCFFVKSEIDAYKAAYLYRNSAFGVEVKYAFGSAEWMVTVFNEKAKNLGISYGEKM